MRKNHITGGLIVFGVGLFFAYANSVYVVEFIKGAIQPITLFIGIVAIAAEIFGKNAVKRINYALGTVFLIIGLYGLYDEYYAVLDFFYGFIPLFLLITGTIGIVHGINQLK
jgi:tetrahydromethanopterin S-methyltransferase subunit C